MDEFQTSDTSASLREPNATSLEGALERLAEPPFSDPQVLEASFFSARSRKHLDLIKRDSEPTAFKADGVVFSLTKPALVTSVVINGGEKIEKRKIKVEYLPLNNNAQWIVSPATPTENSGIGQWNIGRFISSIRISSVNGLLSSKQKVVRLTITGYPEEELAAVEESVTFHQNLRDDVARIAKSRASGIRDSETMLQAERKAFQAESEKKENEIRVRETQAQKELESISAEKTKLEQDLSKTIESVTAAKSLLTTKKAEVEAENSALSKLKDAAVEKQKTLTQIEEQVEQKTSDRNALAQKVTELQEAVRDWASRKNLFTANLEGVFKEYKLQAIFLMGIALIPIFIVGKIGSNLFEGARAMLDSILISTPSDSIWAYLVSRLPFATFGAAICVILIKYAFLPLVENVAEILRTRRRILAATFLIKEVSEKVAAELGMSPEDTANLVVSQRIGRLEKILVDAHGSPADAESLAKPGVPLIDAGAKIAENLASSAFEKPVN